jgi:hypothetical protein
MDTPATPTDTRTLAKDIGTALPDAAIALACLVSWFAPNLLGPQTIQWIVSLMLLEFVVVHSAGFMGLVGTFAMPRGKKIAALVGLAAFYSLFAGGFSLGFHSWWPLISFWSLCLNRMLGGFLGQPPKGARFAFTVAGWVAGFVFYLAGVTITCILPIPAFGITPQVVAAQNFRNISGLWVDEPQRAVLFGVLYFSAVALWEFAGWRMFVSAGMAGPDGGPGGLGTFLAGMRERTRKGEAR